MLNSSIGKKESWAVDEAAAKKLHDKSLNDSMGLDNDDVFAQGLKFSMKNLLNLRNK